VIGVAEDLERVRPLDGGGIHVVRRGAETPHDVERRRAPPSAYSGRRRREILRRLSNSVRSKRSDGGRGLGECMSSDLCCAVPRTCCRGAPSR
jgi:hypothetical protein